MPARTVVATVPSLLADRDRAAGATTTTPAAARGAPPPSKAPGSLPDTTRHPSTPRNAVQATGPRPSAPRDRCHRRADPRHADSPALSARCEDGRVPARAIGAATSAQETRVLTES